MFQDKNRETLVIIDTSVIFHQIHNKVSSAGLEAKGKDNREVLKAVIKAQLCWVASGYWLSGLIENPKILFVCDSKPYWRADYLLDPVNTAKIPEQHKGRGKAKRKTRKEGDTVAYKAGRKLPDYTFTTIKEMGYQVIEEKQWPILRASGYEADDLAAATVKVVGDRYNILLLTVDTDWLGMVSPTVAWFCSHGWFPRIRYTMSQVNHWALKRLGQELTTPSDIWSIKAEQGDKSDNLPPGSPIEVIDLFNPPADYQLWNTVYSDLIEQQTGLPASYEGVDRVGDAVEYLRRLGIPLCVRPYDLEGDLYV